VPERGMNFMSVLIWEGDGTSSGKDMEPIFDDSALKHWVFTLKSTIPWILVMVHKRD
jgi:hypothetical protein